MKYTIWRISPDGTAIQIQTAGETSVLERALEKARIYNERLKSGEPDSEDRFTVLDENGKEIRSESDAAEEPSDSAGNKKKNSRQSEKSDEIK